MNRKKRNIILLLLPALTVGCGKKIDSAKDLAEAFKRNGIQYRATKPVDLTQFRHARIDEAITLKGDELSIEIFRITHEKTYKLFAASSLILTAAEKKTEQRLPGRPDIYSRKPFIIIVREEPHKGDVKKALNKILPEKDQ